MSFCICVPSYCLAVFSYLCVNNLAVQQKTLTEQVPETIHIAETFKQDFVDWTETCEETKTQQVRGRSKKKYVRMHPWHLEGKEWVTQKKLLINLEHKRSNKKSLRKFLSLPLVTYHDWFCKGSSNLEMFPEPRILDRLCSAQRSSSCRVLRSWGLFEGWCLISSNLIKTKEKKSPIKPSKTKEWHAVEWYDKIVNKLNNQDTGWANKVASTQSFNILETATETSSNHSQLSWKKTKMLDALDDAVQRYGKKEKIRKEQIQVKWS